MSDPTIDRILRDMAAEDAALRAYRRAARIVKSSAEWAQRDGWDEEAEAAERLLGHLRDEIAELERT